MFSIPNHKSLGPDGFSNDFSKTTWHSTGPIVCAVVRNFLKVGHMPLHLSAMKLMLLSKIAHLQNASDYRLILCCNVLYKVISKLLSALLKEVQPSLINQSQGAFI